MTICSIKLCCQEGGNSFYYHSFKKLSFLLACRFFVWDSITRLCWLKYENGGRVTSTSRIGGPDYCDNSHGKTK